VQDSEEDSGGTPGADETEAAVETKAETKIVPEVSETQILMNVGLTLDEIKIAILIAQGESPRDISRRLHISASDLNEKSDSIRDKLKIPGDPAINAIVARYNLSKRETDMLRFLRQNKTNEEITAELFLSDETVRIHIRNLLKKIPVENRSEVAALVASFEPKPE